MIHKTRSFRSSVLAALLCVGSAVSLLAQGPGGPPPGGGEHHGPPHNPLFNALDTNHDGVLSADEIANASTSLKALLKNGATELKREDLRPPRPDGAHRGDQGTAATDKPAPAADNAGAKPADQTDEKADHPHHGPPPSKLFEAVDTNHDGVISAAEMDAAPAAIKSLLKNGATELKREDLRPDHPPQHPE